MNVQRALQKELLIRQIKGHVDLEKLKEDACLLIEKIYMLQDVVQKMHLDKLQEIRLAGSSPAAMARDVKRQLDVGKQMREAICEAAANQFTNETDDCQRDEPTSMPE